MMAWIETMNTKNDFRYRRFSAEFFARGAFAFELMGATLTGQSRDTVLYMANFCFIISNLSS